MSKTIDLQVQKSTTLLKGIRSNLSELKNKGVDVEGIDQMENDLQRLREANDECDRLREELSVKVKAMNAILSDVKDAFAAKKKSIKGYYMQEEWQRFGVMDKR